MRVVCQRVTEARVRVGGELRREIGPGLVAFVGIARGVFGARMDVELVNAGPVTIVLDS